MYKRQVRGNADFVIFWNFWIFPDRNRVVVHRLGCYHWLCGCTVDSFEDFGSHWPRAKSLDRPKLEIARVDRLENPKCQNPVRDWDFDQILDFAVLLLAPRRHLHSIPTGCRVYLQGIWICFERVLGVLLLKIEMISQKSPNALGVSSAKGK